MLSSRPVWTRAGVPSLPFWCRTAPSTPGDVIIAGTAVGRVRAMRSDKGVLLNDAGPSTPVEITGLTAVPEAGDLFEAVEDERLARELAEQRVAAAKEKQFSAFQKVTLDNLFSQIGTGRHEGAGHRRQGGCAGFRRGRQAEP